MLLDAAAEASCEMSLHLTAKSACDDDDYLPRRRFDEAVSLATDVAAAALQARGPRRFDGRFGSCTQSWFRKQYTCCPRAKSRVCTGFVIRPLHPLYGSFELSNVSKMRISMGYQCVTCEAHIFMAFMSFSSISSIFSSSLALRCTLAYFAINFGKKG